MQSPRRRPPTRSSPKDEPLAAGRVTGGAGRPAPRKGLVPRLRPESEGARGPRRSSGGGDGGPPRYQQIAADLMQRLRLGEHPVGSMLPTEIELGAGYGVSRHTIREALRALEELGLVLRRRGAGTTVIAAEPSGRFSQEVQTVEQLLQYPENTKLFVLRAELVIPEGDLAARLGTASDVSWLRIDGVRRVRLTAAPICSVSIYVPPEYADVVEDIGTTAAPVYDLVAKRYGLDVAKVEVDILAATVPASRAEILEVDEGTPALLIIRQYRDQNGSVFEVSESLHPAPRFTYRLCMTRR